jgi:hypothetical protein
MIALAMSATLEADAKSLFLPYDCGRLHGAVRPAGDSSTRLFVAPWSPRDETHLRDLCKLATELGAHLEVFARPRPGGGPNPWARMGR